jgi:hypothetical protein
MKVLELFEDDRLPDEAPFVLTVMRNLLKKGTEVRFYYKGDGGIVKFIEWDPPQNPGGNGATSVKLEDNRWIVINDKNLEKLQLRQKKSHSGAEWFTLSNSEFHT